MTDKLELRSSHEVIYTVNVADVESIFYCKPTDPDILTVLMSDGKRLYCDEVCPVDSRQEEPKFKTGDRIKPIDSCLGSQRTIVDVCGSWYVTDQGTLDFEFEDNWELVEESVSRTPADIEAAMQEVEEKSRAFTEAHNGEDADTILAEMRGEEPVSDGLEEESKEWLRPQLDKSYANYGETKMMELTHFDGYAMLDAIEFGAKWQEAKDQEIIETAIHHAYHNGRLKMKEQMMANTTDAMIGLPYENKNGGYTHLIDVSRPLPVGNNKIAIIFKEE